MSTTKYPAFSQALRDLAPTNRERAALLGVSVRSVIYYIRGDFLPPAEVVKRHPQLDEALAYDLASKSAPDPSVALIAC